MEQSLTGTLLAYANESRNYHYSRLVQLREETEDKGVNIGRRFRHADLDVSISTVAFPVNFYDADRNVALTRNRGRTFFSS
jgi:hypothetical protein